MEKKELIYKSVVPMAFAILGFVITKNLIGVVIGVALGLFLPAFMQKMKAEQRIKKFAKQIPDGIALISSCLKAGLSLTQSIEVLCNEMPDPISGEFENVLKSLRIGVSLNDAFYEMSQRINLEELKLVFTAVLVARDTGGDLPKVLTKLVDTLRDRRKLEENIATYTIQGKIQAGIMVLIPVGFVIIVLAQDKNHFDVMTNTDVGRMLLILAFVLQVVAFFAIIQVSKIKI